MTRRQLNRAMLTLLGATAVAFVALIGMLVAGVDPFSGAVMTAQYALLLLGGTTLILSIIGNHLAPRQDDPKGGTR